MFMVDMSIKESYEFLFKYNHNKSCVFYIFYQSTDYDFHMVDINFYVEEGTKTKSVGV